jgi:lipoprotein-releasing system permease protein
MPLIFMGNPIISLPVDIYNLDSLPVSIHASDVISIYVMSIVLSLIATVYPARQAAALDPVEAIRHE